jgi:hypothetical protein
LALKDLVVVFAIVAIVAFFFTAVEVVRSDEGAQAWRCG